MSEVRAFIASGILEMYVLGQTTPEESALVEKMATEHIAIRKEINEISYALESYAQTQAVEPDPILKPFLMATVDYMERMNKGEVPAFPPQLHPKSTISDYDEWLPRSELYPAKPLINVNASILGYSPEITTAIVWLKLGTPPETHTHEYEKFLIVEGTCDITIGNEVHNMKPGDVLTIPMHISHHVNVTSPYPCKIILQRIAA
ncbi:MAG: cupin domain-containing protein [Bacteroidota bacterium]